MGEPVSVAPKIECAHDAIVELHKLVPHPRNPNKHGARQIEILAKIIDHQGQRHPIVVSNQTGFIVAGHGRLMALQRLAWPACAVDYQDFKSAADEYAFIVADNKIAELAEHDDAMMIEDIKAFEFDDFELLGLDDFTLPIDPDAAKDAIEDDIPANAETRCKPGDIWILGEHRLMCGDSTNIQHVERLMNGEKADMVFTDPPYGINVVQSNSVGGAAPTQFGTVGAGQIVPAKTYKVIAGDDSTNAAKDFYNLCVSLEIKTIILWGGELFHRFPAAFALLDGVG